MGSDICYSFEKEFDRICWDNISYYKDNGYKIITYKEFMKGKNNMKNQNKITNLEWILENVDESIICDLRICAIIHEHVQKNSCNNTKCCECKFRDNNDVLKFLNEKYGNKIKLTKFEYDLLEMAKDTLGEDTSFSITVCYNMQYKKGYFKNVDSDMTLKEILENCEVTL